MRTFLAALLMVLATQAGAATDAVYEFKDQTRDMYLSCTGDTEDEKQLMLLSRNGLDWKVRIEDVPLTLDFKEMPGPKLFFQDLNTSNPIEINIDLRKYSTATITMKTLGSTSVMLCENVTEQLKILEAFREKNKAIISKDSTSELNNEILQLKEEIDILELQLSTFEALDETETKARLNYLCGHIYRLFPEEYEILIRKRIPTPNGLKVVCQNK